MYTKDRHLIQSNSPIFLIVMLSKLDTTANQRRQCTRGRSHTVRLYGNRHNHKPVFLDVFLGKYSGDSAVKDVIVKKRYTLGFCPNIF